MTNKDEPGLCTYFDFADALPHKIPRRQLLRMADAGRFPPYTRPAGLKSEPVFAKKAVLMWLKQNYEDLIPEYVARIEREGFTVPRPVHGRV